MATKARRGNEERRREVVALVTSREALMKQHRESRASYERGEPPIPGEQVRREAQERRERA